MPSRAHNSRGARNADLLHGSVKVSAVLDDNRDQLHPDERGWLTEVWQRWQARTPRKATVRHLTGSCWANRCSKTTETNLIPRRTRCGTSSYARPSAGRRDVRGELLGDEFGGTVERRARQVHKLAVIGTRARTAA